MVADDSQRLRVAASARPGRWFPQDTTARRVDRPVDRTSLIPPPRSDASMKRFLRVLLPTTFVVVMVAASLPAGAQQPKAPHEGTQNLKLMGNVPSSGFRDSDLAFDGKFAYAGNFGGFRILDISAPGNPKVVTEFFCNGPQNDVSVYRGLLFQSIDTPQSSPECDSTNVMASTPDMFEGIRVFDVSDVRNPEHVASIQTDCGSHTHTLVPDGDTVYIYVSSYPLTPANWGPGDICQPLQTGGDGHGYISIIELDVNDPAGATVHKYFLDDDTAVAHFDLNALGVNLQSSFVACHDISVFLELNLAAGACMSEAQVWDISDPLNPEFLWRFDDPAVDPGKVDLWHSAAFSWDGSVVAFGDESGGGGLPRCLDPTDDQGRIWFLNTESATDEGELLANYKIPRSETGICTMHNFNFIPTRNGQKVLVSSAYTAGTSVVDVDALIAGASEAEAEIAWFKGEGDNAWSSYWYNGHIYTNGARGVDVLLLSDRARASAVKQSMSNPQTQDVVIGG
jgi:hypothetical protein